MIARNFARFCLVLGSFVLALPDNAGAASQGSTTPGTYRHWGGEIDEVTILQPFGLDNYSDIAVESFDTGGVLLPNPQENTFAAAQLALNSIKPAFIEGFQKNLRQKPGQTNSSRGRGETLVIRARLTQLDPGSQAARFWGRGLGGGSVKVEMIGEVIDARSRKTLVRFRQKREAGFGAFGGGYGDLFARTARHIGRDVADLLNAF